MEQRPSWDEYALAIAAAVSLRGDCTRRKVGAVLLDIDHRIAGAGYNGAEPGGRSCLGGDCPRGRHYKKDGRYCHIHGRVDCSCAIERCICFAPWPCESAVSPGSSYDTGPGACISTHAEINCVMDVDNRDRLTGATLYVTDAPCDGCLKIIRNTTKIAAIRWPDGSADLRQPAPERRTP